MERNKMMKINYFDLRNMTNEEMSSLLKRAEFDISVLQAQIKPIVDEVKEVGDKAVFKYTKMFDKAEVTAETVKVTEEEFEKANKSVDPELRKAIEYSAKNIKKYHEKQMPEEMWFTQIKDGIMAGEKITPIPSVALYAPRGKGSFPSVIMMLAIPAVIAGVEDIIICTPPTPEGEVDDVSLVAAQICGVKNVYKVGGSQAIAAVAYGTESIPKMNKVIGPGSSYVSAAKRLLYGTVDVGVPAGPSESVILADETTTPYIAALDLLIEAEHGPDSSALLVTHSQELIDEVRTLLPQLIEALPENRQEFIKTGFSTYGGFVKTESLDDSIAFVNEYAPEHMEVLVQEPFAILGKIKNAGEILLGENTPITAGNFSLGVNAILPTGGFAKTFSSVTVFDFLKRTSIGYMTREGFDDLKDSAAKLAEYEGFPAHANAIKSRFKS
jgi:histidinol dehydrogenase